MRTPKIVLILSFLSIVLSTLNISNAFAENHKCKGADGKIEYSDRPCVAEKSASSTSYAASEKPVSPTVEKLNLLFAEYEERLCERERLSNETDRAARNGTLQTAGWATKEAKLRDLNEDLVQFQAKASKFTSGKSSDSEETMAVRQFQIKVRKCGKLPS
jgi:hypothetical protein